MFLLTDDLDVRELPYMPNVRRLLTDRGVSFSRYFVSNSLCCPSRTSILRGQYAHNTGVETNGDLNGGFETAYRLGIEKSTVGTWLHDAGYRTAYIGKYLNQYPDSAPETYVPPGWDEFASSVAGNPYSEYDYALNENKRVVDYGRNPADYGTSVYIDKAKDFIRGAAGNPFFLYLNVYAPHQPATPAPRDRDRFPFAKAPRTPSFNRDVPGKPFWLSSLPPLNAAKIRSLDSLYRARLQSLQAVDRGVATLIRTLQSTGELANTYFVFSSDNGFHLGQFQMPAGKETAYDSDIRVPLIVRGPGVPAGATSDSLVGNIDIAPTFAQLAGVPIPDFVDGRSFAGLLSPPPHGSGTAARVPPRTLAGLAVARATATGAGPNEPRDLDARSAGRSVPVVGPDFIPPYRGVRTQYYMYVEYSPESRELYAIDTDPYEMYNLAYVEAYAPLVARLHALVGDLATCAGATCRTLEDAPLRPDAQLASNVSPW